MTTDEAAVADALVCYQRALNESDLEGALAVYALDGVFMPQHSPSSVGKEAVRQAYERVFTTIKLRVVFAVAEIHQLSPDWILARTTSSGTSTVLSTNATTAEGNQELFLFHRNGGDWKIARYCFSTTLPPHANV